MSAIEIANKSYDYIIVGAGSAGCLLANRLSADPANQVLVVEAGGKDNYPWIHIPVGYLYCINNPRTDWCFTTEPESGLNNRSLLYPRGKTLGGCSAINGMIYMRGQARDYDSWAEASGDKDWCWDNVLPDFKKHEDYFGFELADAQPDLADMHGHGGEWRVEEQRLKWPILDAFAEAAEQAGIPKVDDFNTGDNFGTSYFQVNQRKGWRWSTAKGFLHPIRHKRKNLTVLTDCHVEKLALEQSENAQPQCRGIKVRQGNQQRRFDVRKEVILSAGAVASPQILQLSGIGDRSQLAQLGIESVAHLPGVGQNLQDHLQIRTMFKISGADTLNQRASTLLGKAKIAAEYALFRRGPMSMAPSQLGVFTRSDESEPYANLEFHVQPLSLEAFGQPLHDFPAITASVCHLNPTSRGSINIVSTDPWAAPLIQPNYLSTEYDRQVAADAIRAARNIAAQPAMSKFDPQEIRPGAQFTSDDDLAIQAGNIGTTIFHPVGTAKMGRKDDDKAVVDSHLKVRGIDGLRVVDASIMPTITSGNTNSPTLMIAEKAARWILNDA